MDGDRKFIEELTYDGEVDKLEHMNINQLISLKKKIMAMKKGYDKQGLYKSKDDDYAYNNMMKYFQMYYPVNDVTDAIADKNRIKRRPIENRFAKILRNNRNIYISDTNYPVWIKTIDDMMGKRAYNHKEYMNQKVTCECGTETARKHLSRHKSSQLHIKKLLSITS